MPAPAKLPDVDVLVRMKDAGMTLQQIADRYEVSHSAVWRKLDKHGEIEPFRTADKLTGWDIEPAHRNAGVIRHLWTHNRIELGKKVTDAQRKALAQWLQKLQDENLVLDYDPQAGPNPASSLGGFIYRPRTPEDTRFYRRHAAADRKAKRRR